MKYAVIRTGGKQYKIAEGDTITVERLTTPVDQEINFSEVLLYTADGVVKIGNPLLGNVVVAGKVLANVRGNKIRVSTFKAKSRYRRTRGHRQDLSKVQISYIGGVGENPAKTKEEKSVEKKSVAPKRKTSIKKT